MHRRLLLLVVAALLLRGWVGEAMAGQMLVLQLQAAGAAVHAVTVHGPDCQSMAAPDAAPDVGAASCAVHCQDCTLNALPAAALPLSHALPAAPAVLRLPLFASAEPQPGYKPPIS